MRISDQISTLTRGQVGVEDETAVIRRLEQYRARRWLVCVDGREHHGVRFGNIGRNRLIEPHSELLEGCRGQIALIERAVVVPHAHFV
jgi:hypothetical protein